MSEISVILTYLRSKRQFLTLDALLSALATLQKTAIYFGTRKVFFSAAIKGRKRVEGRDLIFAPVLVLL